ncbi:MAG: sigma-70 family RNA polymerase sigma factor [Myxococcales bacterium]|nr:sigma-70 family RNA polymerase sigma factor [Myxococcales bacterium]
MTVFEARPRLLQAFRMGERPALRTVYLHYVDDVFALARHGFLLSGTPPRRIPGESDGERVRDTVQQVFVRAFARRARMAFDGVRRYRPYLLTIAKNLCVDLARRAGRELPASEPAHAGGTTLDQLIERDAAVPCPEDDMHFRTLAEATRAYLSEQTRELKNFVELRFEQELSQYEVMEAMGVTRRRVRTLEATTLQGLRRYLSRRGLLRDEEGVRGG